MADTTFLPLGWLRAGRAAANDRLFQTLGDVSPGLLWVLDPARRFLHVNHAWEEFTGSNLDQSNDLGWERFHHPDDLAGVRAQWERALEDGRPFDTEVRCRRRDGKFRWMLTHVVRLNDNSGQHWVGTSVDVDDFKQIHTELERSERHLIDLFENAAI